MLELTLLAGPGSTTVRSFATCLCSVMEVPAAHVPLPTGTLQEAMGQWRQWLAGRGFGLAELAKPQAFNWPGYLIALVRTESTGGSSAVLMFGTPAGVVLSPGAPNLAGTPLPGLDVVAGYAVAGLDPASAAVVLDTALSGVVEAVAITDRAKAPMGLVPNARALSGRGLEGDRYAAKTGTFSSDAPTARGYDLTLIEAEVLDELVLPDGTPTPAAISSPAGSISTVLSGATSSSATSSVSVSVSASPALTLSASPNPAPSGDSSTAVASEQTSSPAARSPPA